LKVIEPKRSEKGLWAAHQEGEKIRFPVQGMNGGFISMQLAKSVNTSLF
jgi:hypothetical protein